MRSVAEIFSAYEVLDADGRHVNGTDKNGPNHTYGDAYEFMLRGRRESAELVMEVGVADGSSLLAWSEVFPNARCVGLDIHHSDKAHGDRIEFHLGDQCSLQDCLRAAGGRMFDFICEDATHHLGNSLQTLLYLWPSVKPGGMYVVEEFCNAQELITNITALWPCSRVVNARSPSGGTEPLIVFYKPVYGHE